MTTTTTTSTTTTATTTTTTTTTVTTIWWPHIGKKPVFSGSSLNFKNSGNFAQLLGKLQQKIVSPDAV